MRGDQVRERIDSGDIAGAVKLILRDTVAEVKTRVPAQQTDSLAARQEKAANEFFARHPEIELQVTADPQAAYEFGNRMAIAVRSHGLDGTNVEHWEVGFKLEQASRPTPRPRQETAVPSVPLRNPQRRWTNSRKQHRMDLIDSYGGTRGFKEFFDSLTAKQMEGEMRSLKFQRAVELTFPQSAPSLLTRGDHVSAAQAIRMAEISGSDPRELERAIVVSRDLHAQAYARSTDVAEVMGISPWSVRHNLRRLNQVARAVCPDLCIPSRVYGGPLNREAYLDRKISEVEQQVERAAQSKKYRSRVPV